MAGKVAIVTGAASGMGAAIARRFSAEGAQVILTDIQEELCSQVAESCGGSFRLQDVANPDSWNALSQFVSDRFGRLDILVNNAGILSYQSIENTDLATWNRTMGVNLTGPMLGCQAAIALMRQNPGEYQGSIINIASTAAYGAIPDDLAYTASKSAVRMLTKSIAVWCARARLPIRCNSIHPGAIQTAIHDKLLAESEAPELLLAAFAGMSPMSRMGAPDEIAAMATFLASDEASFVTGGEYLVDGGMMAVHPGV
ncbi:MULTISPECIES: SDR family NAD(P)-dependent oxidoreductase [Sphingobium]|uniref:SDR family NAD(P)-dependent oxidoreductase n=1 Tax=Sphingobium sp. MI1205 TaxID=407020 RepID=UPI00210F3C75|nr:glucose 1-dehydrogenase [Sphingobium sp. MI1205]